MDSTDVFHELNKKESNTVSLQVLSLLHYVYSKLIDKTKKQYNIPDDGDEGKVSDDEGEEQKAEADGDEEQKGEEEDDETNNKLDYDGFREEIINTFLMNLLFESAFDEMAVINYEKIKFLFWDYDQPVKPTTPINEDPENQGEVLDEDKTEPNYKIFDDFNEKQYFILISSLFARYFRRQYAGLLEDEREKYEFFLKEGFDETVSRDTTNYRTAISNVLFEDKKYKPLDFDYLLLKQIFITSMMPSDPVLSISIGDLVDIYNILV